MVGLANLVGTYIAGQSGRFIEKRRGLSLIYFGRCFMFLGLLFLPITPTTIIVLSVLLGLFWLSTVPLTSSLVATFFGTRWMSMLFGVVFLSHQVGSFTGLWLAGYLYDATKSYDRCGGSRSRSACSRPRSTGRSRSARWRGWRPARRRPI